MNNKIYILLISLFITSYDVCSQATYDVDKWMEYVEEMAMLSDDEEGIETLYSELSYLSEHPLDLNHIGENELRKLPFLSDMQVDDLLKYRKRYGNFASIYELKHIESLDNETLSLLIPFIKVEAVGNNNIPLTVDNLLKKSRNELLVRVDRCFQQKAGYGSYPDSVILKNPNKRYLGEPFYTSLRYGYSFDNKIMFGLTAEKDAGEPFLTTRHKGYDYYSIHLLLKDMNRWLKTLAVGDYRVSFGQGLTISQDFFMSRSALVMQMERRSNGIRRHFSTNENDYMRGIASTVTINQVDVSAFYSYKQLDARVDNFDILSFKTDGLHRVELDWEKRNAVVMQTAGANIRYSRRYGHIGLTSVFYTFGKHKVAPESKPYNLYQFRGNSNINIGIDYKYYHRKLNFYGETAISKNGGVATLNAIELTPASYVSFVLLQRYYDRRYQAFYANGFSQNSAIENEQGIYFGMKISPFANWQLSGYTDVYKFPWMKYGIDKPSEGSEYMIQADCSRIKNLNLSLRYRYRDKAAYNQQQFRFQALYVPTEAVKFRTILDYNNYHKEDRSSGWMVSQSIGYGREDKPLKADLYLSYFNTDDYYSRIYSMEKSVIYAFNNSSFYGKGFRVSSVLKYNIFHRLTVSAKFGLSKYLDRSKIGSGLEEISGSLKTDLLIMIGYKF